MTNYVFGKFYKTKRGRKVVCTLSISPLAIFRDDYDVQYTPPEIESEWQDEKPNTAELMEGILKQWRDETLQTLKVLEQNRKPKRKIAPVLCATKYPTGTSYWLTDPVYDEADARRKEGFVKWLIDSPYAIEVPE